MPKVNPKKLADPLKYRAQQLRGYWLARSKKIAAKAGKEPQFVPSRQEIEDWLREQFEDGQYTTEYKALTVKPLDDWQVDHSIPIERGGSFKLKNCSILTKQENQEKGSLSDSEYGELLDCVYCWPLEVRKKFLGRLRMGNYRFTGK